MPREAGKEMKVERGIHMNCRKFAVLLLLSAPLALLGQAPAPAPSGNDAMTPASSDIRGAAYPTVSLDGRAEFRLKAPNAKSVLLVIGDGMVSSPDKGPFPMTKDADGVWSVTLSNVVVGFHYYQFNVDGLFIDDPASETFEGFFKETSGIEVPEQGVTFDQIQDVPQGALQPHYYFSKTTGKWRRCYVYTPPSYASDPSARYPVLYLQHGSSETEQSWGDQGRLDIIMNNLIAAGKAKPMIVVNDLGYADFAPGTAPPAAAQPGTQQFAAFESVVINDLIPNIDASFRTIADRDHRAMAGLSMGGSQTLFIALENQDKFGWIASLSFSHDGDESSPGRARSTPPRRVRSRSASRRPSAPSCRKLRACLPGNGPRRSPLT